RPGLPEEVEDTRREPAGEGTSGQAARRCRRAGPRPGGPRAVRRLAVGRLPGPRPARQPRQPRTHPHGARAAPGERSAQGERAAPKGEPPSPPDGRKDPNAKAPAKKDPEALPKDAGTFPYLCLVEPGGKRAFVSLWSKAALAVIDLEKNAVSATWPTAEHPTEI